MIEPVAAADADPILTAEVLADLGLADDARARYAASASLDPWRVAMGLALLDLREGDARRAEAGFQHALSLRRDAPDALLGRGLARLALGRPSAALVDLVRARAAGADDAAVSLALGQTYVALGRLADAEGALADVARAAPANLAVQAALARVLRARGESARAEDTLVDALTAAPDVHALWLGAPEVMHRQALDHLRAGDMAAASVDIERLAAAVEPTARALLELAKLAAAVGDGAAAAARIDAALALAPDVAEAHFVRGVLHELAARPADAGASYAEALACDPTHWRAATNRAALLAEDGDPVAIDEASRLLDVAERYGRGPIPPLLVTRARIHERRGEADLAAVLRETAALLADWP